MTINKKRICRKCKKEIKVYSTYSLLLCSDCEKKEKEKHQ